MAEVNERLARVETRLDNQGEMLARLDRHMEAMSSSHAEMAKAVSQIPSLFNQMLDIQRITVDQGDRLTALETEMAQSRKARERLTKVIEPRVNRSHTISSITAWTAAIAVSAVITATAKGWIQ